MTRATKIFLTIFASVTMIGLAVGLPVGLTVTMNKRDIKHYLKRVIHNDEWKHMYGKGVYYYQDFQYLLFNHENYAALVGLQNPSVFTDPKISEIKLEFRLNYDDSIYSLHRIDSALFYENNQEITPITNNASFVLPGTCDMLSVNNNILDDNNISELLKNQQPFFPKGFSKIVIPNPELSNFVNKHFDLIFGSNYTKDQIQLNLQE